MAAETHLTIAGNLTSAPRSGASGSGATWARLRLASTSRIFDRTESVWRDGDTVFLDVVCWRRLADNVVSTLQRGDRVLVSGRVRQRTYEDGQGSKHTVTELEADAIGPDLSRHAAKLLRPAPLSADETDAPVGDSEAIAPDGDADAEAADDMRLVEGAGV